MEGRLEIVRGRRRADERIRTADLRITNMRHRPDRRILPKIQQQPDIYKAEFSNRIVALSVARENRATLSYGGASSGYSAGSLPVSAVRFRPTVSVRRALIRLLTQSRYEHRRSNRSTGESHETEVGR